MSSMNFAGLVLGMPRCSFACACAGDVFEVATHHWVAPPATVAVLFHEWIKALAPYDRVRLWSPREIPPSASTLYRLTAEACGDRLEPVDPRRLRLQAGVAVPTGREYLALAKSLTRKPVRNVDEAIAVLLAADGGPGGDGARPV